MSSKKTTKQNATTTVTPSNPEWVTGGVQDLMGKAAALAGQDPHDFFAGATPLVQDYFGLASGLGANGAGLIGQAAQNAQSATQAAPTTDAQAQTAFQGIGDYFNPYLGYVAGNTLNELGRARDLAEAGNGRDAILAGGYGGSRQGVADANLNRDFLTTAGNTLGNLYSGGFNTALGAANQDADRAQQASMFNAAAKNQSALSAQQAALQSAGLLGQLGFQGVGALGGAGDAQQALAQQGAGAPLSVLQQLVAAQGSLPLGLFNGSTQDTDSTTVTKSSNPLGQLASLASLAAIPFTGGLSAGLGGALGLGGAASGLSAGLGGLGAAASGGNFISSGIKALGGSRGLFGLGA
jgi:hypothetical protein